MMSRTLQDCKLDAACLQSEAGPLMIGYTTTVWLSPSVSYLGSHACCS